jgi:hypothetical protein
MYLKAVTWTCSADNIAVFSVPPLNYTSRSELSGSGIEFQRESQLLSHKFENVSQNMFRTPDSSLLTILRMFDGFLPTEYWNSWLPQVSVRHPITFEPLHLTYDNLFMFYCPKYNFVRYKTQPTKSLKYSCSLVSLRLASPQVPGFSSFCTGDLEPYEIMQGLEVESLGWNLPWNFMELGGQLRAPTTLQPKKQPFFATRSIRGWPVRGDWVKYRSF